MRQKKISGKVIGKEENVDFKSINFAEVITILVPMGAFFAWIWNRLDKKFDKIDEKFDKIDEKFGKVDEKFGKVDQKIDRIIDEFRKEHAEMRKEMTQGFNDLRQEIRQNRIEAILFQGGHIELKKTGTKDQ